MISFLNRRFGILSVDKEDKWWASGVIETSKVGWTPKIKHNLNTTEVGIWVWPNNNISFSGNYQFWSFNLINWPSMMPEELVLDFTSYNGSKYPEPITVNPRGPEWAIAQTLCSPASSVSSWLTSTPAATGGLNFPQIRNNYDIGNNDIQLKKNFAVGKYRWIAVNLNKAYEKCAHDSGFITQSSYSTISIEHNLNSTQILLWAFPVETVKPTGGYQLYTFGRINFDNIKPSNILLDFSSYNTNLPEAKSLTPNTNTPEISSMQSPWTTQS